MLCKRLLAILVWAKENCVTQGQGEHLNNLVVSGVSSLKSIQYVGGNVDGSRPVNDASDLERVLYTGRFRNHAERT